MILGGLGKSVDSLTQKASKANQIKSIKLKVKFNGKQDGRVPAVQAGKPAQDK